MFFTRLAKLVAVVVFVLGAFHILLGLAIATGFTGPAALARYSTASSAGGVIDKGLIGVLLAIALGTLAEISLSSQKRST